MVGKKTTQTSARFLKIPVKCVTKIVIWSFMFNWTNAFQHGEVDLTSPFLIT